VLWILAQWGKTLLFCMSVMVMVTPPGRADAKRFDSIYSFTGGSDGEAPYAGLIADTQRDLYGTTVYGGASDSGTVFEIAANGTETVLYSFCAQTNCTDGRYPYGGLIADKNGNLYGTTAAGGKGGGADGGGTVYQLAPDGTETVLYSFCSRTVCADGSGPQGGLIADKKGNLYGTTAGGGSGYTCGEQTGCGAVFKLARDGTESVLYSFCTLASCSDGRGPNATLIDRAGNLYGTTSGGGAQNGGTVFRIATDGTESVVYSFGSLTNCADGCDPLGNLIADTNGNLYGTTYQGGGTCPDGCGTVFKVAPDGTETVLHAFTGGSDGANPYAGLLGDKTGNLYGTTELGGGTDNCGVGPAGCGTVFEITATGSETVLHSFGNGRKGAYPFGELLVGARGHLFGTTEAGGTCGSNGCGTVFELSP
jgi:uncharacterized repeat protein (TIGR03803 family)